MDIIPVSYPEILPSAACDDCIVNAVKWYREFRDERGLIAKITVIVIGILVVLVLALSIIGLPLLLELGDECDRQKAQAVFKQNIKLPAQHFFYDNHDIFDKVYPWLTYKDLRQLSLASRSFCSLIKTNSIVNRQEDWFARNGFKTMDVEKSMGQHINAYKYLNQSWHFSPKMIEILGGIIDVYQLPVARKRTIGSFGSWPFPSAPVIKVIDVVTKEHCIAFRFNWYANNLPCECIEFYRVSKRGEIHGLLNVTEDSTQVTGMDWVVVPPKLFLERLGRIIKHQRVGHIASMAVQLMVVLRAMQQNLPLPTTRGVRPFNSRDLPLEAEPFDLQLMLDNS